MKKTTGLSYSAATQGLFFIPFILMIIILSITGIWPFGTKTILTSDLEKSVCPVFSLISEKFIKEIIVSFILFPKHSG